MSTLKSMRWLHAIGRAESQISSHIRGIAHRDTHDIDVVRRRDGLNGGLSTGFQLRSQTALNVDDILGEVLDLLPSDTLLLIHSAHAHRDPSDGNAYLNIAWNSSRAGQPLFGWTVKLNLRPHRHERSTPSISERMHAQTEAEAQARAAERLSMIQGLHPEEADELVKFSARSAASAHIPQGVVSVRIYENIPWWIRAKTAAVAMPLAFRDVCNSRRE